jgi:Leucine-rich repeat (LRR) protein
MTTPITGEKFIRTLRHYLEANEHRLLSSHPNFNSTQSSHPPTIKEEPPTKENGLLKVVSSLWNNATSRPITPANSSGDTIGSRPTSLYGIPIPYMSLLAATSPNATALSNTPYMPLRSSLTLDIHYLYFLLVQFENLGLEDTKLPIPPQGLVETETTTNSNDNNNKKAPSISSVGSVMSTMSLSTGWQFWSNKQTKVERPLHEDIVWIHRYFAHVSALKLHLNLFIDKGVTRSGQRTIRGYEHPMPLDGSIALSLKCFKNLQYLELSSVHPHCIDDWPTLKASLTSLTVKGANIDNATDVVLDEPWPQLKMLSLSDNSLTTLDPEPAQLLRSLSHLNLASNLLIDIPAALATFYNLSSLNLSHNMISSTTGIYTVLGNIQELDLRGNRLTMLAGLDRLWALERLDVRDNRIEDAAEVGRLTSLPNISDIWIEGNPFTKLQVSEKEKHSCTSYSFSL